MYQHRSVRFPMPALMAIIAALRLCGCAPAPSQPLPPDSDTLMLVKQGSRFTYLEEHYDFRKPDPIERSTISWVVSQAAADSLPASPTLWQATIVDDSAQRITIENRMMKFLYRKNGDVIMRRYFDWNVAEGYVDMVIPLWTRADVELPYYYTMQQYQQGSHQYTYSSFTRTTTCRYLGRDTIEVAGERMACEHGQVVIMTYGASGSDNYPVPSPNLTSYGNYAVEYWFAPSLGFIVKERVDRPSVRNSVQGGDWVVRTLQSYELK